MSSGKKPKDEKQSAGSAIIGMVRAFLSRRSPLTPDESLDVKRELAKLAKEVSPDDKGPAKHLRCPACWTGYGGVAKRMKWWRAVNSVVVKRCYCCDQCGTEWVVEVRREDEDGEDASEPNDSPIGSGPTVVTTKIVEVREP